MRSWPPILLVLWLSLAVQWANHLDHAAIRWLLDDNLGGPVIVKIAIITKSEQSDSITGALLNFS